MTSNTIDRRYGVSEGLAAKMPCRVVATTNITLSGEQTIDSVAVVAGDRVLLTGQTDATANGVYVVVANRAWSRAKDFDGLFDIVNGTMIFVATGTIYGRTVWAVNTADDITIGTTQLTISLLNELGIGTQQNKTAAGNVTVAITDRLIRVNKTIGAATTITLPPSLSKVGSVKVVDWKGDAATNNITVNTTAPDAFQGGISTMIIEANGGSLVFDPNSDGSGYSV